MKWLGDDMKNKNKNNCNDMDGKIVINGKFSDTTVYLYYNEFRLILQGLQRLKIMCENNIENGVEKYKKEYISTKKQVENLQKTLIECFITKKNQKRTVKDYDKD